MRKILRGLALIAALSGCAGQTYSPRTQTSESRDYLTIPSPNLLMDYIRSNGTCAFQDKNRDCQDYRLETEINGKEVRFKLANVIDSAGKETSLIAEGTDVEGERYFINFLSDGLNQHLLLQANVGGLNYLQCRSPEARKKVEEGAKIIIGDLEKALF